MVSEGKDPAVVLLVRYLQSLDVVSEYVGISVQQRIPQVAAPPFARPIEAVTADDGKPRKASIDNPHLDRRFHSGN